MTNIITIPRFQVRSGYFRNSTYRRLITHARARSITALPRPHEIRTFTPWTPADSSPWTISPPFLHVWEIAPLYKAIYR